MNSNFKLSSSLRKKVTEVLFQKKRKQLIDKANSIKKSMLDEFKNHLITREINNGPRSANISGTLSGYGNLFSFIGFEDGQDPILPILTTIESISIDSRIINNTIFLNIKYPSVEDIWLVTPMPWQEGRSWAKGIESGISGLNYYSFLKKESDKSRSGFGVQSEKKQRNYLRYLPTQYISTLLKKYKTKFLKIEKNNIDVFTTIES